MRFQRRRHLERYLEIGRILAKHGLESLLIRVGLSDLFHTRGVEKGVSPQPEQVREALEELGPAFVKLGQVLSTRSDLLPAEYIKELEKLQDRAPGISYEAACRVIEEEFGVRVDQIYSFFDRTPLAAASLGQTHAAILKDGTEVVVKVQRPGVREVIETDLEILIGVAGFVERHFEQSRSYSPVELADEFAITLRNELDYTREGRNGDILRENLKDIEYARIAGTIWEHTSSRVLTAERIRGVKISDLKEIKERGLDRRQIARNLSRIFLKMIFLDGFFHADPHPGNLVAMEDNVIGLLDYGMVGRLDRDLQASVTMLLAEYVDQDSKGFAEAILQVGSAPQDIDRRAFNAEIDRLLRQYYGAPLREVRMGDILQRALGVSSKHGVMLPASLALLVKVMVGVEGIDRLLDLDYDFSSEARPFIQKAVRNELAFSSISRELAESLLYWKSLILSLPNRTSQVLDRMADGNFRVVFHHEGLEKPSRDIDRSANRLSLAMISSATIISSSVVVAAQVGPFWRGYPIIGLLGFLLSVIFGAWLMLSIIRAGRLW